MADAEPFVLIVEDEEALAETFRLWIDERYETHTAHDGETAIELLDETVDVVLLDRRMPGLSGGEVLEYIRGEELDCRVAMVTAVDPDFDILSMPFDTYLSKPVARDALLRTVEELLERSTYDSLRREYYALIEKRATIEASKDWATLEETQQYQELTDRIDRLREELAETIGEADDDETLVETLRNMGEQ